MGLLGVDQSVLLLKKGNDIEQSTVFSELSGYNQVDKYNYEWSGRYDYSYYTDFDSSDAVVITNAIKQYGILYYLERHFLMINYDIYDISIPFYLNNS